MFKNLIIYRLHSPVSVALDALDSALRTARFTECGASQEKSSGWLEPRGQEHGMMVESINGHWILKFMVEVKSLPASVLNRKLKERIQHIEQSTGRKPGKKEGRDLKEEIRFSLLPHAFTQQASTWIWINPKAQMLCVDASSQSRADEIITALGKAWEGLGLSLLDTQTSPQTCMAQWLLEQEAPAGFALGQECELKASDETKAAVRYARHRLDTEEVQQHIQQGKLPTRLGLQWDDRVQFLLTEGLQLKKINFEDVVFEGRSDDDAGFDADVAIATAELEQLLPDLIQGLGGAVMQPDTST